METNERKSRKNGFEYPWHIYQILTWLLLPLILTHYYAFLMFLLWHNIVIQVILTLLFTIFTISLCICVYYTVSIDPIDDMYESCSGRRTFNNTNTNTVIEESNTRCYLCEKDVHHSSKHCRECEKCVLRFDHHCKWYYYYHYH